MIKKLEQELELLHKKKKKKNKNWRKKDVQLT